jgi:hypothetical protein
MVPNALMGVDERTRNNGDRCRGRQNDTAHSRFAIRKKAGHGCDSVMGDACILALNRFATFNAV